MECHATRTTDGLALTLPRTFPQTCFGNLLTAWIYVTTACDQCDSHPNEGPAVFVAVE